jgi:hypothetical protein
MFALSFNHHWKAVFTKLLLIVCVIRVVYILDVVLGYS